MFAKYIANVAPGILYASTSLSSERGHVLLQKAVDALLASVEVSHTPDVLWSAQYQQHASSGSEILPADNKQVLVFPPPLMDHVFDDTILDSVKDVWQKIVGEDEGEFLVFQDREQYDYDE